VANRILPEFQDFLISRSLAPDVPKTRLPDVSKILTEMRQAIRIKHYSYRTERSYLEWAERFMDYGSSIKKKDIRTAGLDSGDVKDFLSYLALTKRVLSSTQNRAFNALLFLFRYVLKTELGDLSKAPRLQGGHSADFPVKSRFNHEIPSQP